MPEQMMSYADNFEDVLLRRLFPDRTDGFFIDVGAYDPADHSVTKYFYDRGWRGVNVEPNPAPFAKLVSGRERDINLNVGLSDREGTLTLYEAPSACWSVDQELLTGYFRADQSQLVARSVPVTTLAKLCERHVPSGRTIDFLKIDVEGHEAEVVRGGDWSRWRPRVILIEANKPETWEPILLDSGFLFAYFDGVNRFYLREEDRHLLPVFQVPVNTTDNFLLYGYMKTITGLDEEVSIYRNSDGASLRAARWLRRAAAQHPMAASIVKRVFFRAAS